MGGNFELRGTLPVLFQTNQGEPTGTGTQIHSISNVTIFAAGAAIQHTGGSSKALDITNSLAGGVFAFSVNPQVVGDNRLYTSGAISGNAQRFLRLRVTR
jgi:hypothetical protein